MAGRAERLVADIRAQRRQVRRAADALFASRTLGRRIRSAPVPWLLGAGLVGLIAGRWFARPLAAAGRRRVAAAVGARAREALVTGLLTVFGLRSRPGGDGAARHEAAAAADLEPAPASAAQHARDPALSPRGRTS